MFNRHIGDRYYDALSIITIIGVKSLHEYLSDSLNKIDYSQIKIFMLPLSFSKFIDSNLL